MTIRLFSDKQLVSALKYLDPFISMQGVWKDENNQPKFVNNNNSNNKLRPIPR